jgi:hypothetical protein
MTRHLAGFCLTRGKKVTDAATLYQEWQASGMGKRPFHRERYADAMSYGAFAGRLWRYEHQLTGGAGLFQSRLSTPWTLDPGHYIVVGDVQLPTTDYGFAALPLAIAEAYIPKRQRNLILAGDLLNADAFSLYESDAELASFNDEIEAARLFMADCLAVFDCVYWIMGNHERRPLKRTRGALKPAHLLALITHDKRVSVSEWGHCTVRNPGGADWRITHGRNYSVNQLTVADQLAQKYQANIISHHEHHLGMGWDRFKRYIVVNNGGLFNPAAMAYAVLDDSKMPNMTPGFSWLKPSGHVQVFGDDPFTDWDNALSIGKRQRIR